jgi:uncharacterized protein (TIGR03435 family)
MQIRSRHIRGMFFKSVFTLTVAYLAIAVAHGQAPTPAQVPSPQASAPNYDVVSIKPNKSGSGGWSMSAVSASFKGTNLTIANLVMNSYDLTSDDLIYGLPGWTRSAHFDVYAKIVNPDMKQIDNLTDEQREAMILAILKDRFHFQAHLETKTLPVYDLVVANGGAKFTGGNGPDAVTAAALAKRNITVGGMVTYNGEITAGAMPLSSLVSNLTNAVGRTVVDKTGLTGKYNFELKWNPEQGVQANADNGQADPENSAPSLFTALQEQLGLKLQSSKGPVETLVVDHVEMPSAN